MNGTTSCTKSICYGIIIEIIVISDIKMGIFSLFLFTNGLAAYTLRGNNGRYWVVSHLIPNYQFEHIHICVFLKAAIES